MDDKLYQDDFEQFLQDQVKNQRMYPSDPVWRNIHKELHGEKNWPALTIAALGVLIATVAVCVHFSPKPNIFAVQPANHAKVAEENSASNLSSVPFLIPGKNSTQKAGSDWIATQNQIKKSTVNRLAVDENNATANKTNSTSATRDDLSANKLTAGKPVPGTTAPRGNFNVPNVSVSESTEKLPVLQLSKELITAKERVKAPPPISENSPGTSDPTDKNIVDNFLKEHEKDLELFTKTQTKSVKNKFSYLLYLAPSISYRRLREDQAFLKGNPVSGPVALNYVTDVNNVVRHKPGTGVEAGVSVMYNLSNNLRIKSGVQFNLRQYSIEAFKAPAERASIALITNSRVDTLNAYSVYRTNTGYVSTELVNRYYQVAVPVGVEWEIAGGKNFKLNVAGTIQPTYLINRNAYMLSTNFKNYSLTKGMMNNWNVNSNIETFISFKAGDYRWQLGPQIRYQHLPTFTNKYPIKEHLMDYGFKIGVSKIIL